MALNLWVVINLALAFFNLLPVPPLDGNALVERFLPKLSVSRGPGSRMLGVMALYMILILGGAEWLFRGAMAVRAGLMAAPILPPLLVLLAAGGALRFHLSGRRSKGSHRGAEKRARGTETARLHRMAGEVGTKIGRGMPLTSAETRWLDRVRPDAGDGQALCASTSFQADNDFCEACPNRSRCAVRRVEETVRAASDDSRTGPERDLYPQRQESRKDP